MFSHASVHTYINNILRDMAQIWHKCPLELKDERILKVTLLVNVVSQESLQRTSQTGFRL